MGKQSNAFQRLCAYLQEQFHAPAKVEESVFLPDKDTGQPREIDVLVTIPADDHMMLIGFECRDRKAVDDVTFVELTSAKHEATGINVSVLYSASGFTAPARRKAQAFGMRLVQAEQGLDEDWPAWLRELKTAYWAELLITLSGITIETSEGLTGTPPPNLPLVDVDGARWAQAWICNV